MSTAAEIYVIDLASTWAAAGGCDPDEAEEDSSTMPRLAAATNPNSTEPNHVIR